jgi:hypothetical protein
LDSGQLVNNVLFASLSAGEDDLHRHVAEAEDGQVGIDLGVFNLLDPHYYALIALGKKRKLGCCRL